MFKKSSTILIGLLAVSMILGACSKANEKVVVGTATPAEGLPATGGDSTSGLALPTDSGVTDPAVLVPGGTAQASSPDSLSDLIVPAIDWSGPWANFFKNMPDDFYIVKIDALANELASATPPFLLDVRDASEIARDGYIQGAMHLPFSAILGNLNKLPAVDQPIVIYSSLGHRGAMTLSALRMLGYSNVRLMEGGLSSWLQSGRQVVTGTPPEPAAGVAPNIDPAMLTNLESFILGTEPTDFYGIEAVTLQTQLSSDPKPFLLDVRNPEEAATSGTIEGSTLIPLKTLLDNLAQLPADKDTSIVTISTNGHRATIAMMALRMLGYSNVTSLFGGINEWVAAGQPVIK